MAVKKNEESRLTELKEKYKVISKRYNLPDFDDLNREFSIEKIAEEETDFIIREISRVMSEKVSTYLRLSEAMLNPSNSTLFTLSIMKTMENDEKRKLTDIYKKLAKIEIDIVILDTDFSEEKTANFINSFHKEWKEIKEDFLYIFEKIKSNWDDKKENNSKTYFG